MANQIKSESYEEFVEKFKPKKTTDDCYTPANVYEAIRSWAVQEYGLKDRRIVRPFYPGGDFENFDYQEGDVVLDNPPFSLFSKIIDFYDERGIDYFLFAPHLTIFNRKRSGYVITNCEITYENGATISTSFLTSLGSDLLRTAPDLRRKIIEADKENQKTFLKKVPRMTYPDEVLTSTRVPYYADFRMDKKDAHFTRALDHQKEKKKTIFGAGYLISEAKAKEIKELRENRVIEEKAAGLDYTWRLSDRERAIVEKLGRESGDGGGA